MPDAVLRTSGKTDLFEVTVRLTLFLVQRSKNHSDQSILRIKATRPENNPIFPTTNQNGNLAGDSRMSKILNPIVIGSKSRVKLTSLPRGSTLRKHEATPKLIATRQ